MGHSVELQVTPIAGGAVESSPRSWSARGTAQELTSCALRSPPATNRGFLGDVGCGTVMLKPLAVQGFRVVLQLALECPPKFRQHRTIALGFVSLGVAAAIFEVGL